MRTNPALLDPGYYARITSRFSCVGWRPFRWRRAGLWWASACRLAGNGAGAQPAREATRGSKPERRVAQRRFPSMDRAAITRWSVAAFLMRRGGQQFCAECTARAIRPRDVAAVRRAMKGLASHPGYCVEEADFTSCGPSSDLVRPCRQSKSYQQRPNNFCRETILCVMRNLPRETIALKIGSQRRTHS
jgi:hypothetical protein